MEFEHEIETAEPLFFVLRRFVEQISRRLGMTHQVVAEFQLRLGLSSGAACERTFKLPSPTGDIEVLFRMLHTDLDDLRTDSPIVSLRLEAKPATPETRQLGLFETSLRNPDQFSETLARLSALCGVDRVGFPVAEATHRPDAFRMEKPDFNRMPAATPQEDHPPGLQLRRFRPGIHAIIEFRRQEPALINSPVCRGSISDFRGPFTGSGGWWDASRWAREEWDIQIANGGLYRVVLSEEGCLVEGVYD
jgi:protein ImuB